MGGLLQENFFRKGMVAEDRTPRKWIPRARRARTSGKGMVEEDRAGSKWNPRARRARTSGKGMVEEDRARVECKGNKSKRCGEGKLSKENCGRSLVRNRCCKFC